jgi:hypothetical protein
MKNRLVKVESTWVTVSLVETVHSNINRELEKAASSASGHKWFGLARNQVQGFQLPNKTHGFYRKI